MVMDLIHLAYDRVQWFCVVTMVMNFPVSWRAKNLSNERL